MNELIERFDELSARGGSFEEWNALMNDFVAVQAPEYVSKCYENAIRAMKGSKV